MGLVQRCRLIDSMLLSPRLCLPVACGSVPRINPMSLSMAATPNSPTASLILPDGDAGQSIAFQGINFAGFSEPTVALLLSGAEVAACAVTFSNDTHIACDLPGGSGQFLHLQVTADYGYDQEKSLPSADTLSYPQPTLQAASLRLAGGQSGAGAAQLADISVLGDRVAMRGTNLGNPTVCALHAAASPARMSSRAHGCCVPRRFGPTLAST